MSLKRKKNKIPEWLGDTRIAQLRENQKQLFDDAAALQAVYEDAVSEYDRFKYSWSNFEEWRYQNDLKQFIPEAKAKWEANRGYYRSAGIEINKQEMFIRSPAGQNNLRIQKELWDKNHMAAAELD